jgi:hypothetical protein
MVGLVKAVKVRLGMARRVSARRSRYGSVRSGMSGRGKAVMAGLGQARQGMAVKVRRGAVWSGVVRRSW